MLHFQMELKEIFLYKKTSIEFIETSKIVIE